MQEADLTKPFKEEVKASCSRNHQSAELSVKYSDDNTKHKEIVTKPKPEENFTETGIELPPIPKTACQFIINWRKYTSPVFRYKYIKVSNNLLCHAKYEIH